MKQHTFIVDIGHADGTGARGNGLEEHAENVTIAKLLCMKIQNAGHKVYSIDFPHETNGADLAKTVAKANTIKATLGISLHSDCSDSAQPHGGHVEYNKGSVKGKRAATCVAKYITKLLPGRADAIVPRPNAKQGSLMVLRQTVAPWILVEGGFISNVDDALVIHTEPEKIADAIFKGVMDYINTEE